MDDLTHHAEPETLRVHLARITAGQEQLTLSLRDLRDDLREVRRSIDAVPGMVDTRLRGYVTTDQFQPVRALVFGLVSLVGVALVGGLMSVLLHGVPK